MEIKSLTKTLFPFILGALIGAGLSRNRYVYIVIISYIIIVITLRLFASKITKVKESSDKKLAVRNAAVEGANEFIDTTEKGHLYGASLFNKYYPNYILIINLALLISIIYFIMKTEYVLAIVCFGLLNFFVILNQIWRKVKYLDTKDYDDHIKEKIFKQKLEKKTGVIRDGNK